MHYLIHRGYLYVDADYEDVGFTPSGRWGNQGSGMLFTTGDRILLLHRSWQVEEPGTWGIPGGAVPEDCEGRCLSPLESAKREVLEELGRIPSYHLVGKYVYEEDDFLYTTFICRVAPSALDMKFRLNWENDEWRWFTSKEVDEMYHSDKLHFGVEALLTSKDPFK